MHWTDKHITEITDKGVTTYYGWDETGVDTVYVSENRSDVVKALLNYSICLEKRRNEKTTSEVPSRGCCTAKCYS